MEEAQKVSGDNEEIIQKTEITTSIQDQDLKRNQSADETSNSPQTEEPPQISAIESPNDAILANPMKLATTADPHIKQEKSSNLPFTAAKECDISDPKSSVDKQDEKINLFLKSSFDNHPYKHLLMNFEPSVEQLSPVNNIEPPKSLQETPLCEINTKEELEKLIDDLQEESEIGVDVEWSDHGYKAVTCLVQISTKDKDFIIDAIDLKEHMSLLKAILTNLDIVKVFHASANDLRWLQQDFDLFVVNMFDTQKAMKALAYKKLGLDAALLNYGVVKDKSMQRVDFRKRPLPPKYKDYARTDSHFLIHVYQTLKNELIEANALKQVLEECNNDCKVVHEKVEDSSYQSVREEIEKMYRRQLTVLQKLNQWRHKIAEYVDINTGHVLSKNNLKTLVVQMPVDPHTIVKIAKSDYVKQHLQEIVAIMTEAKPQKRGLDASASFDHNTKKLKFDRSDFDQTGGFGKRGRNFSYGRGGNRNEDEFDLRDTLRAGSAVPRSRPYGKRFRR